MTTIRSRRNPPGTRTRSFRTGSGTLQRQVDRIISGTLLDNSGGGGGGGSIPDEAQVTIEVNRTEGVAPQGFYFVAKATGFGVDPAGTGSFADELAHYNELRYLWDFDDEGKVFDRMEDGENFIWDRVFNIDESIVKWNKPGHPSNDPEYSGSTITFLGIDKNKAFGPHTGTVFAPTAADFAAEKASSGNDYIDKTITVEVLSKAMARAGDPPVTASVTVRVHNPDVFFGDAKTVYISPTSDFPAGASNTFTSLDAAMVVHRNDPRIRFRFNRNEVHDVTVTSVNWGTPDIYDLVYYGDYGPGIGDPVIKNNSFGMSPRARMNALSHSCTYGLKFLGDYEPAAPWTGVGGWDEDGLTVGAYANHTTVWDCHFEGFKIPLSGTKDMQNQMVGNCRINKFWNYGYFSNIGIAKCNWSGISIAQEWDAIITSQQPSQGRVKGGYPYDVHGPFRVSHAGKLGEYIGYVSHNACYFRSNGGWGGGHQPSVRMGGNGQVDEPMLMRTSQERVMAMVGGSIGNGVFKGDLYPHMQVFDKIIHLALNDTGAGPMHSLGCSGVLVRNILSIVADTPAFGKAIGGFFGTRGVGGAGQHASLFQYPIKIISSMGGDHRNDTHFINGANDESFTPTKLAEPCYSEWVEVDNLIHTPNRGSGTTGHDTSNLPLSVIQADIGLDYPGYRFDTDPPLKDSVAATVPRSIPADTAYLTTERVTFYVPAPGSPAYQTGDPVNSAIDDLFGNIRPADTPSKGPIEPGSV